MDSVPTAISDEKKELMDKTKAVAETYLSMRNESTDHTESNPIWVGHTRKNIQSDYKDYNKRAHNVDTNFHSDKTITFHGTKHNVRKAVINHHDDEHEARKNHPHLFDEECNSPLDNHPGQYLLDDEAGLTAHHLSAKAWKATKTAHAKSAEAESNPHLHHDAQAAHYHAAELHAIAGEAHGKGHPAHAGHGKAEEVHTQHWEHHRNAVHDAMTQKKPSSKKRLEEDKYKSETGGLTRAGVDKYNRENPGHHLKMAVTTPPSELDPHGKAAARRHSFCARMSGVKGPMKDEHGKPTRKALALKKWNC